MVPLPLSLLGFAVRLLIVSRSLVVVSSFRFDCEFFRTRTWYTGIPVAESHFSVPLRRTGERKNVNRSHFSVPG